MCYFNCIAINMDMYFSIRWLLLRIRAVYFFRWTGVMLLIKKNLVFYKSDDDEKREE